MVTYSKAADQNYEHDIDFLRNLARTSDVYLIIERGQEKPPIDVKMIFLQKSNSLWALVLEHIWIILQLRMKGVKIFYSRNSLINAIISGFITRLVGGATYFWSCGEIKRGHIAIKKDRGYSRYLFETILYWLSFKLIKGLVTGTKTMKNYYQSELSIPSEKIIVIPNWVDLQRFKPKKNARKLKRKELSIPNSAFVVLFPRSLSERHGPKYLPEIISALHAKNIDAYLVASGKGVFSSWLKTKFKEAGLEARLRLLYGVPNLDMPNLFAACDATIVPSNTEGFPRVLLESMAVGTPFVVHDVGGVRDIVSNEQSELLIPLGDTEKFAETIFKLKVHGEWKERVIEAGLNNVKNYDVLSIVNNFRDLFENGFKHVRSQKEI